MKVMITRRKKKRFHLLAKTTEPFLHKITQLPNVIMKLSDLGLVVQS